MKGVAMKEGYRITKRDRLEEKWQGERYYCYPTSKDKSAWYFTRRWKEGNKTKTKFLHKEIYEYYHGKVAKGFHVHHLDGDRRNNDLDNLIALSHSDHIRLHAKEQWEQEKKDWICADCGVSFHGIQRTDTIRCPKCDNRARQSKWRDCQDKGEMNEYRRNWYAENKHEINKKRRERDRRNRKEKKAKGDIDSILNFL
jgi:rubrerythrin